MQLLTVVGARPQFIKAAALSRAIAATGGAIQEHILHTGQHYDTAMSDQFFAELGIPAPAFHLGIGGGSHGANTGRMLEAIERVLLAERPDAVLVYGDTDSTLAGALAASKLKIPVVHVEAGLRSFNRHQPEEQNRVLTDHLADLCFAPTDAAVAHLRREGIAAERIVRTGDVMADGARIFGEQAEMQASELLATACLPAIILRSALCAGHHPQSRKIPTIRPDLRRSSRLWQRSRRTERAVLSPYLCCCRCTRAPRPGSRRTNCSTCSNRSPSHRRWGSWRWCCWSGGQPWW
jgi:hypothetical protein